MAGLLHPLHRGSRCRTATAVNFMLGVFHVLLPCIRQGEGQVIEPMPSMVELWQVEDAELILPTQVLAGFHQVMIDDLYENELDASRHSAPPSIRLYPGDAIVPDCTDDKPPVLPAHGN